MDGAGLSLELKSCHGCGASRLVQMHVESFLTCFLYCGRAEGKSLEGTRCCCCRIARKQPKATATGGISPPLLCRTPPRPARLVARHLDCRMDFEAMHAQADASRYAGLLYAKLQEAAQHAAPAAKERPSKRRRVAAKQQPAARQDTETAEDDDFDRGLLLDRDYDARVQQVWLPLRAQRN